MLPVGYRTDTLEFYIDKPRHAELVNVYLEYRLYWSTTFVLYMVMTRLNGKLNIQRCTLNTYFDYNCGYHITYLTIKWQFIHFFRSDVPITGQRILFLYLFTNHKMLVWSWGEGHETGWYSYVGRHQRFPVNRLGLQVVYL